MYYPHLYGLASELLALRDLPKDSSVQLLSPTIEPVKSNPASLLKAMSVLKDSTLVPSVVINPSHLDFRGGAARAGWWAAVEPAIRSTGTIPALEVTSATTRAEITAFGSQFPKGALRLVVRSDSTIAADAHAVLADRDVLVICHHNVDDDAFVAAFGPKAVVRLNDSFVRQRVNADYGAPEWFTSAHSSFSLAGRPGFGDYTLLGSTPANPGGGPAGAVVVHATFVHHSGDLWVAHYVSDTTDRDEGTAAEKLLEAVDKLHRDRARYIQSVGMDGFDRLFATRGQTSLATNKRLQISHHLMTTVSVL